MRTAAVLILALTAPAGGQTFVDATDVVGLRNVSANRIAFVELNGDGRPDIVVDRHRVFLNRAKRDTPHKFIFREVVDNGLPAPQKGDVVVFADLDGDRLLDAIMTRSNDDTTAADAIRPSSWARGRGDGTFEPAQAIEGAPPRSTCAVAVADVNRDGRLDLWLGNWYRVYGQLPGYANDLLLQRESGGVAFDRVALPQDTDDDDPARDRAGRPTYGVMVAELVDDRPSLVELNYGRRWNRLLHQREAGGDWFDLAGLFGFDGDDIRHGKHPEWLKERAKTDARFDRDDEKPFRSNGNTFDAAIGDLDGDGDDDIVVAEITHGWAGDSSDRTRVLLYDRSKRPPRFVPSTALTLDRIPADRESWNQGDVFCAIADLDHDGRQDLILSSGDYPDPPPYDQRLRVYRNVLAEGGPGFRLREVTSAVGIDHRGSAQLSLADVDGDGDLDILVGQSFMRLSAGQRDALGGAPKVRLFLNRTADRRRQRGLVLRLEGDPARGVNTHGIGAVVEVEAVIDGRVTRQRRQLIGIGGHSGKQDDLVVHFGLGDADVARSVTVRWPDDDGTVTTKRNLPAGTRTIKMD